MNSSINIPLPSDYTTLDGDNLEDYQKTLDSITITQPIFQEAVNVLSNVETYKAKEAKGENGMYTLNRVLWQLRSPLKDMISQRGNELVVQEFAYNLLNLISNKRIPGEEVNNIISVLQDFLLSTSNIRSFDLESLTLKLSQNYSRVKLRTIGGLIRQTSKWEEDSIEYIGYLVVTQFKARVSNYIDNRDFTNLAEIYEIKIAKDDFSYDEYDLLLKYVADFLDYPADKNIFALNINIQKNINAEIKEAPSKDKALEQTLIKIRGVLAQISGALYREINSIIIEEKLAEFETAMNHQVNYVNGDLEEPRDNTVILLNGHTGAGKGTTLAMLGVKAVETGTDGIAGRGAGFEQYEEVMAPFDLARFAGIFIPDKLMRLLFASEMMSTRKLLDNNNKYHEGIYVSGFPRSAKQATAFKGIDKMKSLALTIEPETAIYRTVRRIVETILKGESPRPDDLSDLILKDITTENILGPNEAIKIIKDVINNNGGSIDSIWNEIQKRILASLNPKSRYYRYDKAIKDIGKTLEGMGVPTETIKCERMTPSEVTARVSNIISGPRLDLVREM